MTHRRGDQMSLGLFLMTTGHHVAAWRHPDVRPDGAISLEHHVQIAKEAEQGLFDMVFLADHAGMTERDLAAGRNPRLIMLDPLLVLSAIAMATERIGLVATATTSFNPPFNIARAFATLDHLSGGRAGWNIVTSFNEPDARQYGYAQHLDHDERYSMAEEFVDLVRNLWDSWDDDAFVRDKQTGMFFDPDKVSIADHDGTYYRVYGPLNVPRPPQGHPVLVQAGSSRAGIDLAARISEVVFTAQVLLDDARDFYEKLKARMADFGREPDRLKVLPGFFPFVGHTRAEAQEKFDQMQALIDLQTALQELSGVLGGFDFSGYDLESPFPDLTPEQLLGNRRGNLTRPFVIRNAAKAGNWTLRETALQFSGTRAHHVAIGTPADIADEMEEWFDSGACDGFNIMPPTLPGALTDFVNLVVPELQRRGRYRTGYTGSTLREHLSLPRPERTLGANAHGVLAS